MDRAVTIADLATGFRRNPATIRGWVRQRRIVRVGTGPHGVALYDPLDLIQAEKTATDNTSQRAYLTSEAARPNIWIDGRGVPAVAPIFSLAPRAAELTASRRRHVADEPQQPLTEATMTVTLPNGRRLRIAVVVMPDLDTHARADLLPDLAERDTHFL